MTAEGQQEPSMEDILASIRKILSEDDGEAAKPEPEAAPAPAPEPEPPPPPPEPEPEPAPEPEPEPEPLTLEAAPEEEPVASIFDAPPEEEPVYHPEPEPDMPLQLTDSMMVGEDQQPEQHYAEPEPGPTFAHEHYDYNEGLVSPQVAAASGASIAQLAQAVAHERAVSLGNHGLTLEELVREICTPILKHWLDSNLPYIVERIVKQEIERIASRSERG